MGLRLLGLTLHALAAFYRSLKVELTAKKDEHTTHGTVEWREISGLGTDHGPVSSECVKSCVKREREVFLESIEKPFHP